MLFLDCLAHFLYLKSMCKKKGVLSSADPPNSILAGLLKKYIPDIYVLNKSGPKTEPLVTPENNISHEQTAESTYVLCLRLVW